MTAGTAAGGRGYTDRQSRVPATDVSMDESGRYLLRCELPGVPRDDVDITLNRNELTIRGSRRAEEDGRLIVQEIPKEEFRRTFILREDLDGGGIEAELDRGVLTLTIPRKGPESQSIPIDGDGR
jgi:HSP20 family protein